MFCRLLQLHCIHFNHLPWLHVKHFRHLLCLHFKKRFLPPYLAYTLNSSSFFSGYTRNTSTTSFGYTIALQPPALDPLWTFLSLPITALSTLHPPPLATLYTSETTIHDWTWWRCNISTLQPHSRRSITTYVERIQRTLGSKFPSPLLHILYIIYPNQRADGRCSFTWQYLWYIGAGRTTGRLNSNFPGEKNNVI